MNEQQREAIEKAAEAFPRGVIAMTITPNGELRVMLRHDELPLVFTEEEVETSNTDIIALDRLGTECLKCWAKRIWDDDGGDVEL